MSKEMRKYIDTFKQRLTESEKLNISDVSESKSFIGGKIEVGTEITRYFGKKEAVWRITRIELTPDMKLTIFACPDIWFQKNFDNKQKLYHNDELILKFDEPTYDVR